MNGTPPPTSGQTGGIAWRARSFFDLAPIKLALLGFLVLALLLPVAAITALVHERAERQRAVQSTVASTWGNRQSIHGPIVVLSSSYLQAMPPVDGKAVPPERIHRAQMVLPETLHWTGSLRPEVRRRGIFEVVLYEARLKAEGEFRLPHRLGAEDQPFRWDGASLVLGIPDIRGLQGAPAVRWGEHTVDLVPGTAGVPELASGVTAELPLAPLASPGSTIPFSLELVVHGSFGLQFLPAGKQTVVDLTSAWANPSFDGAFLPQTHDISANGFAAHWEVSYLGRSLPQIWQPGEIKSAQLYESLFGLSLDQPADDYQKTERSVKYGVLFIILTFATIFLLELLSQQRLDAPHYLLVGFALCLFYVLLLAFSEHLGFALAYALATGASVVLITGYARSILASGQRAGILMACLLGLYAFLYVLLQAADYALLMGALGLFAALATVMFVTRRLDWRELRFRPRDAGPG